jgi:GGDEF domain-containing protein
VLTELLKQEIDFQGVTLSISVVDYVRLVAENGKESVERVMSALEGLVQSSGTSTDLVCRISEDEFIVVCPGATGAAATERVQQLSENLWDFQLRSLVSFPILFSWGASECGLMPGMPRLLADSIDRAREQMLETRRSRRALTWASAKYGLQSSAG